MQKGSWEGGKAFPYPNLPLPQPRCIHPCPGTPHPQAAAPTPSPGPGTATDPQDKSPQGAAGNGAALNA